MTVDVVGSIDADVDVSSPCTSFALESIDSELFGCDVSGMASGIRRVSPETMMEEFADVELGDERLNARLVDIAGAMASSPGSSFAGLFAQEGDVEAVYRFMRNARVDWKDIVEAHAEQSAERCRAAKATLVLHDTTTHRLHEDAQLDSYINTGKKGFFGHTSLAVDRTTGRPLGVVAMQCVLRPKKSRKRGKKDERPLSGAQTAKLKNREYDRWARGVHNVRDRLGSDVDVWHVVDREGDSFAFFAQLASANERFVIRECKNRLSRLEEGDDAAWAPLHEQLSRARQTAIQREVHLSRREQKSAPIAAKRHQARSSRQAKLRVAYTSIELRRPGYLTSEDCAPTLRINVVHVYEVDPPAGEKRIEWILLTNVPVQSEQDAESIVDAYLKRWLIEEFFAALKGGCRYRPRRLTNRHSIFNTLATMLPIAWKALDLRQLARSAQRKATEVFSPLELEALTAKARRMGKRVSANTSAQEALLLIARLGGHLKSSGPPGWKTLMRGMERFLSLVEGYALARAEM